MIIFGLSQSDHIIVLLKIAVSTTKMYFVINTNLQVCWISRSCDNSFNLSCKMIPICYIRFLLTFSFEIKSFGFDSKIHAWLLNYIPILSIIKLRYQILRKQVIQDLLELIHSFWYTSIYNKFSTSCTHYLKYFIYKFYYMQV